VFGVCLLGEDIGFMQEIEDVGGKFERLSCRVIYHKGILECANFQLVIVVEVPENAPADLDLQHLYALLLEGHETLLRDRASLLLAALFLDDVLDAADVLCR
jgi:hypothetical protein